jgi:hypothetical protein
MAAEEKQIEYKAQTSSPIVNGDARMKIGKNSFIVTTALDVADVPFADIVSIAMKDYTVVVATDEGDYVFARMGELLQPFYDNLYKAFADAMTRAFFITGNANTSATGDYHFLDLGGNVTGSKAFFRVYETCVTGLTPDLGSRRIPLCFVTGIDKGSFEFTLKLNNISGGSDSYTFSRLGSFTESFANTIDKNLKDLRDKTISNLKIFDPTLSLTQYSQLSKILPEGMAAPMGEIKRIAPSFFDAIEKTLARTRGGASYEAFKEICDPANICVGFRRGNFREDGTILNAETGEIWDQNEPMTQQFLFWMIAPSPNGNYATIEFAEKDTATFVYRTDGDFVKTATLLNRALEATSFKRDVIRMTDEDLKKPENADLYMAAKRTASLQFIRSRFAARVIHTEAWKKRLLETWNK